MFLGLKIARRMAQHAPRPSVSFSRPLFSLRRTVGSETWSPPGRKRHRYFSSWPTEGWFPLRKFGLEDIISGGSVTSDSL
jgi:hypothetical protein